MFAGDSALETMHKQVTEKAPPLPSFTSSAALNACIQAIINHAVEKDSLKRYQTVSELSQDLILLDNFVEKGLAPKLSSLNACAPKSLKPIPLVAISVGIILCGTQMYFWFNHPVDRNLLSLQSHSSEEAASSKLKESSTHKEFVDIHDDQSLSAFVKAHPTPLNSKELVSQAKECPNLQS